MKRLFIFTIILTALTACTARQAQEIPDPATTDIPQVSMPNPASLYCTQNGNQHEIHTAADGSQSGICTFPDGSACDEWAYYRGECGPAKQIDPTPVMTVEATTDANAGNPGSIMPPGVAEEVVDWWGVIQSTESGAQFDDYFERRDLGQIICFGIDSTDPGIKSQIEVLRDSGRIVHLYGVLVSNLPDYNSSQIQVDRIEVED